MLANKFNKIAGTALGVMVALGLSAYVSTMHSSKIYNKKCIKCGYVEITKSIMILDWQVGSYRTSEGGDRDCIHELSPMKNHSY
jgi:hypothetical protein